MRQLQINDRIRLEDGREACVESFLGEGAQGAVYVVNINGVQKALKWFRRLPDERFLKNIRKNISEGSPSPIFLWPEALTRIRNSGVGYVMPLKPGGSYEFSKFRMAKVRFYSFKAIIEAAIRLCDAFRLLHANGMSFQDLNDGGFFINPINGEVAVCDCDNVFPHGDNSGILGKARYMAPEVVMGKSLPNSYTDRFSLSVILFMLFCIDHPFEGFNVVKHPCLTETIEQRLFGRDICFIFDNDRTDNRPVRGVHRNVLTLWPLLPQPLKEAFIGEFSRSKLEKPTDRMTEMQWIDLFISLRDHLMKCPHCGDETFVYDGQTCLNPRCKNPIQVNYHLEGGGRSIPLIKNGVVRFDSDGKISAVVLEKPGNPDTLLLKNVTDRAWSVQTPSGKSISVSPDGFMPVKQELIISTTIKFKIR